MDFENMPIDEQFFAGFDKQAIKVPPPWRQAIAALAAIDAALGLPEDGCNSLAQTLEKIRNLRAAEDKCNSYIVDNAPIPERLLDIIGRYGNARIVGTNPMPSEHEEQKTLFQWAAIRSKGRPELGLLLAIPNGGMRSKITAAKLKAEGVRAGVPDVCLPVRTEQYGSLWIELKRPGERGRPAGRVSPEQSRWIADLQIAGQCAAVCYGWEEARDVIEGYLKK